MKFFYSLIFLFILSCGAGKKIYVCGDHPCVDKKEFNEYFAKNLKIEIISKKKNKKKSNDLVTLNTISSKKKMTSSKISTQEEKLKKKEKKNKLKEQKIKLLEERKIKKAEKKIREKKEKQLNKTLNYNEKKKNITINEKNSNSEIVKNHTEKKKNGIIKKRKIAVNKNIETSLSKAKNAKSICEGIKDCDIDMITELLIKKGKDKPFPNFTSN